MEGDKLTRGKVLTLLKEFMKMAARKNSEIPLGPYRFAIDKVSQGKFSIQDANKNSFPITEETIELINCTGSNLSNSSNVVLRNIQFHTVFNSLTIRSIELVAGSFTLYGSGGSQDVRNLPFTVSLLPKAILFENLDAETKGYLTRLAKRAHMIKLELPPFPFQNLLQFIPKKNVPLSQLADIQKMQKLKEYMDKLPPAELLNERGMKIAKRLSQHITIEYIEHFLERSNIISRPAASKIREIIEDDK